MCLKPFLVHRRFHALPLAGLCCPATPSLRASPTVTFVEVVVTAFFFSRDHLAAWAFLARSYLALQVW